MESDAFVYSNIISDTGIIGASLHRGKITAERLTKRDSVRMCAYVLVLRCLHAQSVLLGFPKEAIWNYSI